MTNLNQIMAHLVQLSLDSTVLLRSHSDGRYSAEIKVPGTSGITCYRHTATDALKAAYSAVRHFTGSKRNPQHTEQSEPEQLERS